MEPKYKTIIQAAVLVAVLVIVAVV